MRSLAIAVTGLLLATELSGAAFVRPMERVATMDPAFAQAVYDSSAVQLVAEPLLAIDYKARPYRLIDGYCALPETSADGLVYRFRALHGPARDVVDTLERLRDPKLGTPNGWMVKNIETIRDAGDGIVEIRLKSRSHVFPWLMAMSPTAVRGSDESGTGPYELVSWVKNHEMVFRRRNDRKTECSNDRNGFDEVRYRVVDDASTQWLMFLKGELDFLGEVSRDNWEAVVRKDGTLVPELAAKGIRLYSSPTLNSLYIGFNMRDPVLGKNRALRQALNCAFDYPEWEKFYSGRILPSDGPVPPGVDGRLETPFAYSFNLANAKRLLEKAGYPGGLDPATGRRLALTLAIGRASQESRESGELIAAFFDRIGVKLELEYFTWTAFLKAVNEGRVQLYHMGWVGDYPDAENFLQLFHSKNVSPGPNHSDYVNPEFDREYDAAMAAATAEERNIHWRKCQEIVREDCPWIFTNFTKSNVLVGPRVGNYVPSAFPYGNERYYICK